MIEKAKSIIESMMPTIPYEWIWGEWSPQHPDWNECIFLLQEWMHSQGMYTDAEEEVSLSEAESIIKSLRKSTWYQKLHENACREYADNQSWQKELRNELRYRP